jgi:tRNA(Ile)-lysidine synthase
VSFTPERLLRALEDCLAGVAGPPPSGLCVALSGGLDSTVLLASLARLRDAQKISAPLRAIHVDHALHADSAQWAAACRSFAAGLRVPLDEVRVDAAAAHGESPEAAARAARYGALKARLGTGEVLLTAHHADDQLETILLQWLRGGGLRAVAGMERSAAFGPGWHARPMLDFPRDVLHAWAMQAGLAWLEDPSNLDTRYDRNYLRLEVLPALRRRWPSVARTAGRVAEYAADALELEAVLAAADLRDVADGAALSLARLHALPDARQRAVLRAWLRRLALPAPAARTLAALRHDMKAAAADRIPSVEWPGAVVRRYRERLHAEAPLRSEFRTGEWRPAEMLVFRLADGSSLELVADVGQGLSRARLPAAVDVAARAEGGTFQPAGAAHRRPLRKWFQDRGVLPWRRDAIPLLSAAGEIVAVADISCAAEFAARPGEPSWRVCWHGRPLLTEAEVIAFNWPEHPSIL